MHRSTHNTAIALLTILVLSFIPDTAHAYLDPGTGSLILQLLVAGILGAMFTIKNFFRNGKAFIIRLFRGATDKPQTADKANES